MQLRGGTHRSGSLPRAAHRNSGRRTAYLDADLREPGAIFEHPDLVATLDLAQPVALSLIAVVHFIPDDLQPADLVAQFVERLAPSSYLTISHATSDMVEPALAARGTEIYKGSGIPLQLLRTHKQVEALVPEGLEIIDPGTVLLHRWRPAEDANRLVPAADEVAGYGLIARKP